MPVTAKLSRKFYDKLGDEVANELVDWFNTVDLSYRSEIREMFETNFSRFEARLAQQTAELRGEFRADLAAVKGDLRAEMAAQRASLIRWMFGFWIGSVGVTLGAAWTISRLLPHAP